MIVQLKGDFLLFSVSVAIIFFVTINHSQWQSVDLNFIALAVL